MLRQHHRLDVLKRILAWSNVLWAAAHHSHLLVLEAVIVLGTGDLISRQSHTR
jgi:hypothetical protein